MARQRIPAAAAAHGVGSANKRKSKKAISAMREEELALGEKDGFVCPDIVKNDMRALRKWNELIALYTDPQYDFNLVTGSDSDVLARYCITHSDYHDLIMRRDEIKQLKVKIKLFEGKGPEVDGLIEKALRLNNLLKIDNLLMKKHTLLKQMENDLFLTPYSKARYGSAKEKKKEKTLADLGFGNV